MGPLFTHLIRQINDSDLQLLIYEKPKQSELIFFYVFKVGCAVETFRVGDDDDDEVEEEEVVI